MKYRNAEQLATWLMKNQPEVFTALARRAEGRAQLAGISDFFSSLGTGVANATSQVGSFLTSEDGLKTLTGLTSVYLQTKAQKDALNLQVKLAQAGQALAPVATTTDVYGGSQPYYYGGSVPQPLTSSLAQRLAPRGVSDFLPLALVAGVGLLAILALRR